MAAPRPALSVSLFGRHARVAHVAEVFDAFVDAVNVSELGVDVIEIPGDSTRHAIADAFADGDSTESVGKAVTDRRAHTGGGSDACDQDRIDGSGAQETSETGAVKRARPFLQQRIFAVDGRNARVDRPQAGAGTR